MRFLLSALLVLLPTAAHADDGGTEAGAAKCAEDGQHAVTADGAIVDCAPYRCGSEGTCVTSCGTSDDCAPGALCDLTTKACVLPAATCSADGSKAITSDGKAIDCAPYSCFDGLCYSQCARDSDCAKGNTCDTTNRTCRSTTASAASNGSGCAYGASSGACFGIVLALTALLARLRR